MKIKAFSVCRNYTVGHTYTTYLVNAHVDVKVAQELLRHANFNTTMSVYAHVDDKKKQNIVNEVFCGENVGETAKIKTLPQFGFI